jgi:hypothetical protein
MGILIQYGFHFIGELTSGEHYSTATLAAFQSNICAEADYLPGGAAAWMKLFHFNDILQSQIRQHAKIITHVIIRSSFRKFDILRFLHA